MTKTEQRIHAARSLEELTALRAEVTGYQMSGKNRLRINRAFEAAENRLRPPLADSGPGKFAVDEAEKREAKKPRKPRSDKGKKVAKTEEETKTGLTERDAVAVNSVPANPTARARVRSTAKVETINGPVHVEDIG